MGIRASLILGADLVKFTGQFRTGSMAGDMVPTTLTPAEAANASLRGATALAATSAKTASGCRAGRVAELRRCARWALIHPPER